MRCIPRVITTAVSVMVSKGGTTIARTCPVATGVIFFYIGEEGGTISHSSCEYAVLVWLISTPVNYIAILIERS